MPDSVSKKLVLVNEFINEGKMDEVVLVTIIAGNFSIEVFSKHKDQDAFYTFITKNISRIDGIQELSPGYVVLVHF